MASPSPAPKRRPRAMRGDSPLRGGDGAGGKGLQGDGVSPAAPVPTPPSGSAPSPAAPGAHPRITHSSRTRRSVRTAPPRPGSPAPTHSGTSSGAPSERSRVFPSSQAQNSPPCSSPGRGSLYKPLLQTTSLPRRRMHFRQAAAGHGSAARGALSPQKDGPILTPPPPRSQLAGKDT